MKTKAENAIFVVMFALATIFVAMAARSILQQRAIRQALIAKSELNVPAAEVIGPPSGITGNLMGQYTLVEFGDYQCPPCHRVAAMVPATLRQYQTKLRFAFRNLPLTSIHPFAMRAAIVAESARRAGNFWPVHNALYQVDAEQFDDHAMNGIIRRYHVVIAPSSMTAVSTDVREAQRLGIKGTPAFLLCTPTGKAYRVSQLERLGDYLDMK